MPEPTPSQEELEARLVHLAERALDECRTSLMMSFRFFDTALWQMPHEPAEIETPTGTDGVHLLFNPVQVLRTYRDSPAELARDYLHTILHCVFRQPFKTVRAQPELWSRACDICIESIALEMCDKRFASVFDGERRKRLTLVAADIGAITPMKVYRRILELNDDSRPSADAQVLRKVLGDTSGLFARDDHSFWQLGSSDEGEPGDGQGSGSSDDDADDAGGSSQDGASEDSADPGADRGQEDDERDQQGQTGEADSAENRSDAGEASNPTGDDEKASEKDGRGGGEQEPSRGSEEDGSGAPGGNGAMQDAPEQPAYEEGELPEDELERAQAAWEKIAREVETDLETLSKERGEGMGNMLANLELANRSQVDYADFLRRFSTMAEDMVVNDEEFDYIFYTYGLKRYGNMPLIEPLEYKESDRVREFVVVLDTSGSCSGELVRTFVTRTYEILHESGSFDEKVNVHLIQCDAEVQSDEKITNVEELARYERGFEVRGMGGTDFRPAFAYVDELLAQGEFEDLRGLIYFTDGWGVFPKTKPDYETAFVFVEEEGKTRRVPPWAMRVVLSQDDIEEL